MVIDAQVVVSYTAAAAAAAAAAADAAPVVHQELLYPPRHRITLPLNNLNFIFDNIEVAFNQTSKWTADKWVVCVCLCVCVCVIRISFLIFFLFSGTTFWTGMVWDTWAP